MEKKFLFFIALIFFLLSDSVGAGASRLIYQPINPSFGGNPGNWNALLSSAQIQDTQGFLKEQPKPKETLSPAEQFHQQFLQRVSSMILYAATKDMTDENGNLLTGEWKLGDFTCRITNDGETLTVETIETSTGNILVTQIPVNGGTL